MTGEEIPKRMTKDDVLKLLNSMQDDLEKEQEKLRRKMIISISIYTILILILGFALGKIF